MRAPAWPMDLQIAEQGRWDWLLIGLIAALALFGVVGVYSASIAYAQKQFGFEAYYLLRQVFYLGVGATCMAVLCHWPMHSWRRLTPLLLGLAFVLLVLVLIPGIGHVANNAARWLSFGPIRFQPSEAAKLAWLMYLCLQIERCQADPKRAGERLFTALAVLALMALLLLAEPDFGSVAVLGGVTWLLLLLGGVRLRALLGFALVGCVAVRQMVVSEDYRLDRVRGFLDPWADPFGDGYQLVQSLIAFGRGGWSGTGLGASVQKLLYLPEAHTDFILAIVAEELGAVSVMVLIGLFTALTLRCLQIGHRCTQSGQTYAGLLASGVGLLIGVQAFLNMAVNMGSLPTKGLTLPLISYGGSSMVLTLIGLGLVLRADHERRAGRQAAGW